MDALGYRHTHHFTQPNVCVCVCFNCYYPKLSSLIRLLLIISYCRLSPTQSGQILYLKLTNLKSGYQLNCSSHLGLATFFHAHCGQQKSIFVLFFSHEFLILSQQLGHVSHILKLSDFFLCLPPLSLKDLYDSIALEYNLFLPKIQNNLFILKLSGQYT